MSDAWRDQTNNKQTIAAQGDLIIGLCSRCDKIAAQISEPASAPTLRRL
jgi:hypothetical protein